MTGRALAPKPPVRRETAPEPAGTSPATRSGVAFAGAMHDKQPCFRVAAADPRREWEPLMSDDEPKSPAELKEIRLSRKLAQEAEGIKAMAEIAATDIAIRKRTAALRKMRLAKEAEDRDQPADPKAKTPAKKKKTK